jgi:2-(1,2-epoxy-1,2-dihydrophenyl)acetyl-CoA isomerase
MTAWPEAPGQTPQSLRTELGDGVLTLTLDRPEVLNALDQQLKEDLLVALRLAAEDREVRVVVLTGAGRAFCAGQDLTERMADDAPDLGVEIRERYIPIILAMRELPKPIIGAINGPAAGAGCSIALACDLRIAAEGASFIQAFGRVGLVPDSGSSWFLPRLIGYARAAEMIFTTEPLDAAAAERIGLVNRVVPAGRLLEEARALGGRLALAAPLALALAKQELQRSMEVDLATALEFEADQQSIAGRSKDHAEGIAAFLAKRPPRFTGE